MNCDFATISRHLQSLGFTQKRVPHELTQGQKDKWLYIAAQNLARHQGTHGHKQLFLSLLETKNGVSVNIKQGKEWMSPGEKPKPSIKKDMQPMKTMICVW